jgi:hypothetical protein
MEAGQQVLWPVPNCQGGRQICLPTQASPDYGYLSHLLYLTTRTSWQ